MGNKLENYLISLGVTVHQLSSLCLEGDPYTEYIPQTKPLYQYPET